MVMCFLELGLDLGVEERLSAQKPPLVLSSV